MSKYLNDPREMAIRPESGVTLEEDNRIETMYHWGAKILDLCDLPVDEYMKPMTVNTNGGSGGDSGGDETPTTKRNISMTLSIISPTGDIIAPNGEVIGTTEGDGNWKARWSWDKGFNGGFVSVVKVYDTNNTEHVVSASISNNQNKQHEEIITNVNGTIKAIGAYGVGEQGTEISDATGKTTTIVDENTDTEFVINIELEKSDSVIIYDLYYGNACINDDVSNNDLNKLDMLSALDDDGVLFSFTIPISIEYSNESDKHDDGEEPYDGSDSEELWESWKEQYENSHRHTLRIYIPSEIENDYVYSLFNVAVGQYISAELVRGSRSKTINNIEYSEYVNSNSQYVYDDTTHNLSMKFIMVKK